MIYLTAVKYAASPDIKNQTETIAFPRFYAITRLNERKIRKLKITAITNTFFLLNSSCPQINRYGNRGFFGIAIFSAGVTPEDIYRKEVRNMTRIYLTVLFALILSGCSMQKLVVNLTEPMLNDAVNSLYEETDTDFAGQALPGNLKLLEGFWKSDTVNENLLMFLVQGYSAYALGYLEDESPERARAFYLRSWNLAKRLFPENPAIKNGSELSLNEFKSALDNLSREDVPRLFWLGMSWGSYINFSKSDPEALADLPKVLAIMDRVISLDENYYFGGAHLFYGTYYASLPAMFGGDPEKAEKHFQKAFAISQNKFLFAHYYYAKFYAYQIQDRKLFEKELENILEADIHIMPGMELPNALAKKRAAALLPEADILF